MQKTKTLEEDLHDISEVRESIATDSPREDGVSYGYSPSKHDPELVKRGTGGKKLARPADYGDEDARSDMDESIYSPDMDKQSFYSAATKDNKRATRKRKQQTEPKESWIARAHANMPFSAAQPVPESQQNDEMDDIILDSLSP